MKLSSSQADRTTQSFSDILLFDLMLKFKQKQLTNYVQVCPFTNWSTKLCTIFSQISYLITLLTKQNGVLLEHPVEWLGY